MIDWINFSKNGWLKFGFDLNLYNWVKSAKEKIIKKYDMHDYSPRDFRCVDTWFIGVNFLANSGSARINSTSLDSCSVRAVRSRFSKQVNFWDQGQVSIFWPGYPKQSQGERQSEFNFRLNRFSAHVDGILPVGEKKRRFFKEPHAFIFGVPITYCDDFTAPLVVWEGSHIIMREAFEGVYKGITPKDWRSVDITDVYKKARSQVFKKCKIRRLHTEVGGSYLIHRLAIHGVAPWNVDKESAKINKTVNKNIGRTVDEGRAVIYFRPLFKKVSDWIGNYP